MEKGRLVVVVFGFEKNVLLNDGDKHGLQICECATNLHFNGLVINVNLWEPAHFAIEDALPAVY